MTEVLVFPQNPRPCCQSLMLKVSELEIRLLLETERRQNEYNQLLRMFISNRKEAMKEQQPPSHRKRENSKGSRTQTAPSARKEALKVAINRRVSHKQLEHLNLVVHDGRQARPRAQIITYKNTTPQVTPTGPVQGEPAPSTLLERVSAVEGGLERQFKQSQQMKELNDYLMEQLLGVFQKIKQWEETAMASKPVISEETVTSVVIDKDCPAEALGLKANNCSSSRLSCKMDLGEVAAKVAEHESILSQLIQLTKGLTLGLSSQIKNIPEWQIPHHP